MSDAPALKADTTARRGGERQSMTQAGVGQTDLEKPGVNPLLGLFVATVGVSLAAIFIALASTPPLVTAASRMALAVLALAPWAWARRRVLLAVSPRDKGLIVAAGLLLALHFGTWTVSLFYTSVASSVLFVTIHPVLVAALGWAVLGERPRTGVVVGIALSLVGSAVIAGGDIHVGGRALQGDLLALAGAAAFALYLLIGRAVRQRLDPIVYSTPVYAVCALMLGLFASFTGERFGPWTARNIALIVALALVCTLGGHLVYNWTLRYLDAAIVSVSFLGEPVLSAALAWPILGQAIPATTLAGGAVVLAGIYVVVRAGRATEKRHVASRAVEGAEL